MHLEGYISATYDQLVAEFGPPGHDGDPCKMQVLWSIHTERGPVSIYDWKKNQPPELITDWNIGSEGNGEGRALMNAHGFGLWYESWENRAAEWALVRQMNS